MKLKWYGTASLLIESGNTRLLVDPYLKQNKKLPPLPVEEAATADAVVITHPHLDHFRDIEVFLKAGISRCYVSQGGIDRLRARGVDTEQMIAYAAGDTFTIGNLTVRAYPSKHCIFDAATFLRIVASPRTYLMFSRAVGLLREMKQYRIGKEETCALEISDGEKSVVVLGSAGMDEKTEYPTGADMLVFPYQGRTGMHEYMVPFLKRFLPKAVLADHFDNAFPPFSHTVSTKKFARSVKAALPEARAVVPRENEWLEI